MNATVAFMKKVVNLVKVKPSVNENMNINGFFQLIKKISSCINLPEFHEMFKHSIDKVLVGLIEPLLKEMKDQLSKTLKEYAEVCPLELSDDDFHQKCEEIIAKVRSQLYVEIEKRTRKKIGDSDYIKNYIQQFNVHSRIPLASIIFQTRKREDAMKKEHKVLVLKYEKMLESANQEKQKFEVKATELVTELANIKQQAQSEKVVRTKENERLQEQILSIL